GDVAGGALIADDLALLHVLAGGDDEGAHVGVTGGVGAVVVDEHVVPPGVAPAVVVVGLDDGAGLRRHDGGAVRPGDVQALVAGIAVIPGGDVGDAGQGPAGIKARYPAAGGGVRDTAAVGDCAAAAA